MVQDAVEFDTIPPQRPVFLKVLCILTFIGSGYGIINGVVTYFKANDISKFVTEVKAEMKNKISKKKKTNDTISVSFAGNVVNNMSAMATPDNLRKMAIGTVISSILCLLGAILMWNLRKVGFYIYVIGTILIIVLPFYLFGINFLTNLSVGAQGFIGIIFVIFYAMNIKSMK
ncbi:MAG TPA: hypothetical protein VGP43_07500 [Chitinophagaceae bacterium]|nr:hypothetical protein [Chitinophagaceae bacterium]